MKKLVFFLPLMLLVWYGCKGTPEEEMTITERKRLEMDPRVGAFLVEGERAYGRGAYGMALAYTDSAEQYAPELADVHFLRGVIYTQLNQLEVAEAAYETVLEMDPAYAGARYNLGLNAFRRGKLRDAINNYKAEQAVEASSNLSLELGRAYAKLGEPDSARMAYEDAIARDSTNATALMWLGQLYDEIGELDKALEVSLRGMALRPGDTDYGYILGSLLNRMGRPEEALAYLEPIAAERPWHHGAQFNLGQVLMRLGREEEAKSSFARADSAQQLQQKINEAQNEINREPDYLDHWINLGGLLRQAGQVDRAIEAYKVAVSLEPWNLYLQSNLGLLYVEQEDFESAIRRFNAILKLDETLVDVWLNLGVAYANNGQVEEAERSWKQALALKPGHPAARAYLARLSEMNAAR